MVMVVSIVKPQHSAVIDLSHSMVDVSNVVSSHNCYAIFYKAPHLISEQATA